VVQSIIGATQKRQGECVKAGFSRNAKHDYDLWRGRAPLNQIKARMAWRAPAQSGSDDQDCPS